MVYSSAYLMHWECNSTMLSVQSANRANLSKFQPRGGGGETPAPRLLPLATLVINCSLTTSKAIVFVAEIVSLFGDFAYFTQK